MDETQIVEIFEAFFEKYKKTEGVNRHAIMTHLSQ